MSSSVFILLNVMYCWSLVLIFCDCNVMLYVFILFLVLMFVICDVANGAAMTQDKFQTCSDNKSINQSKLDLGSPARGGVFNIACQCMDWPKQMQFRLPVSSMKRRTKRIQQYDSRPKRAP